MEKLKSQKKTISESTAGVAQSSEVPAKNDPSEYSLLDNNLKRISGRLRMEIRGYLQICHSPVLPQSTKL